MHSKANSTPTRDEVLREVGQPAARGLARFFRLGAVALSAVLLFAGVAAWKANQEAEPSIRFITTPVKRGDLTSTVTVTGTLKGQDTVSVGAEGVVLARNVEVGQSLVAAMSTAELFIGARDLRQMEVAIAIAIDEADAGRIEVGQRAVFSVDAWPGRLFPAVVRSIHKVAVTKDNVVTYEAEISVRNDELVLRPGMTATVTISAEQRSDVLLVPNSTLRFSPPVHRARAVFAGPPGSHPSAAVADEPPHIWLLRDGYPVEVKVEIGVSDGVNTEVRAAELHQGDLVIDDVEEGA